MKQCLLNNTKLFKICGIYVQFSTIVHLNRSFHLLISKRCRSFFTRTYKLHIMVTTLHYTFRQFIFPSILLPEFFYYIRFKSTVHSSITSIPVSHHLDSFHLLHTARFRMSKTGQKPWKLNNWLVDIRRHNAGESTRSVLDCTCNHVHIFSKTVICAASE